MFEIEIGFPKVHVHRYYLCADGIKKFKGRYYDTRSAAEIVMYTYCNNRGIKLECSEYDKHERKYSNHKGIRFYINRV